MGSPPVTGLALGGLGGFNVHDAGVLKALHDCAVRPDIITATSGAIFWTYQYLTDPQAIPAVVEQQVAAVSGASAPWVAATGIPGVFRPAWRQYWARWATPWSPTSVRGWLDRLWPAQVYEPTRPEADYAAIADAFNATSIPVVFNAYLIGTGTELLFANPAAFAFLDVAATGGRDVEYRPIDAAAVQAALWLVLYGFTHRYRGEIVIDGAYHRQLILAELDGCEVVYAVKPQADAWRARPPTNYFEVQDFNTEMWFNSSYAAEVADLRRSPAGRTTPRIEPITMDRPLGYFHYFVERMRTYTEGYRAATAVFERDRSGLRAQPDAAPSG